ncbi:MAG: two-component regulator propeller domain-containing protein [Bryobacteraceae bacterium]|nr:two-component regulator propeller domain-containing protein [Bryobacteraceae bacterium]
MRAVREFTPVRRVMTAAVLAAGLAFGLDPQTRISHYNLRVWQAGDGLPDNFVQSVVQTRDGYLWLGTLEGLVRFDGAKFTVFDTRNAPQLRSSSVVALCERKDGSLWIGTGGGGVTVWGEGAFRETYTRRNGLAHDHIRFIYEDAKGVVWITAHDGGLVEYSGGQFRTWTTKSGLPTDALRTVLQDRTGVLWFGTDELGLAKQQDGRISKVPAPGGQIRVFLEDKAGRLWIGTRGDGLWLRQGEALRHFTTRDGLPSNAIRCLLEDTDANVWIGTESGGLARYRDGQFSVLSTRDGLPHNFVRALAEDSEGNIWAGTRDGLVRLKDKRVTTWTTADGLPGDNVRSVMEDSAGRMWFGTATGVAYLQDGRMRSLPLSDDWSKDYARAMVERRDGSIWIGAHTGVFRWKPGRGAPVAVDVGIADVRAMAEDRQGRLWIGTAEDGVWVEGERLLRSESVTALLPAPEGGMWIGTTSGLVEVKGGSLRRHGTRQGLGHDMVTCLYGDAEGTLWIGTRGGLSRLRAGRFTAYTRRDGLLSDNVRSVVDDGRGAIWIGSLRGVSRLAKSELEEFAAGKRTALTALSFDTADGMRAAECNGDAQPTAVRGRDGRLWFPTVYGAAAFDPAAIRVRPATARVVIERVLAGSREVSLVDGHYVVPRGERNLEIQYSAISLSAPERLRFRYRMVDFDPDWVDAGQRRSAFYTHAPPGDFHFEVAAFPFEGATTPQTVRIAVRFERMLYETGWFYALCALTLMAAATTGYRVHLRSVRRRYEAVMAERVRIGREIHDTLMQGVTGIALQLEVASQQLPGAPNEAAQRIGHALDQLDEVLAESRRRILELRSPVPVVEPIEEVIRTFAERLGADRGMHATVTVKGTPRRLREAVRENVLRVAREVVTNAARHSGAAHLWITVDYEGKGVRVHAVDDGRGFDASAVAADHFGLRSMRERMAEIGGHLECSTAPGRGTAITVAVEDGE